MIWTRNAPTSAGWYWWRREGHEAELGLVFERPSGGLAIWLPESEEREESILICNCWPDTEWSSTPIAMPAEGEG